MRLQMLQLVGNVDLASLARRETDKSYVLRNVASEANGAKHIYKLNANTAKDAVYVHRRRPDGKDAYEKIWRKSCPRCDLFGACTALPDLRLHLMRLLAHSGI